jgi:S-adenosylmethionine synthetase
VRLGFGLGGHGRQDSNQERIMLVELGRSQLEQEHVEIVERKGLGHPDTICDALAERVSRVLSRYYLQECGAILHHNVDKVLLSAGSSRPEFGGGKLVDPLDITLAGRATHAHDGMSIPVHELAVEACKQWFREHLPQLNPETDIRWRCSIRPTSVDLTQLFEREGSHLANDTSLGVGYAPLSPLEHLVLETEQRLNSSEFRSLHPESGADVKIMAYRHHSSVNLVVARAFIGQHLPNLADYLEAKLHLMSFVAGVGHELGMTATVLANSADDPGSGSVYLTVSGTSAEAGDDGQVGRGNRANGLITPHRPMSLEALAGKNPVNHVGKLYNLLAREIAEELVLHLPDVRHAVCYMLSEIGRPIADPKLVHIKLGIEGDIPVGELRAAAEQIVHGQLRGVSKLTERIVTGSVQLF